MADGIELASAYVSLVPSLKGAGKSIQSQLEGIDMTRPGKAMGKALAESMASGVDSGALKKYTQAVERAERSVQDARDKSAESAKQVEIAEKRLAEMRAKYGEDSSQAAQAELDLVRAQRQSETAAKAVESAQKRLESAQKSLADATEAAARAAERQSSGLIRLSQSAMATGKALQSAGRSMQSLGSGMASVGDSLTSKITAPLATAAIGVGAFALSTASAAETTEISFTTMLGSAEKAEDMMGTLADFAARTPFELSGLQDATRQLLAYGFTAEEVVPMLTAVGDATAALGTGQYGIEAVTRALGQMQTRGKVSAEEMLQLTEAGIPAWKYLAEAIGTDTAGAMEQVSKGAIDASTGIKALTDGMERDFGGMMESQSKTLAGLASNLVDAFTQPLMEIRNSDAYASLVDAFSDLVDAAGPFTESMLPHLESGLSAVAGVVESAADGLQAFADMSEESQSNIIGLVTAAATAGPAMSVLGRGINVAGKATEGAGKLFESFGGIAGKVGDKLLDFATAPATAGTALGKLAGAVSAIPAPMGILIGLVGGAAVAALGALAAESAEAAAHQQLMADVTMDASDIMAEATGNASGLGDAIGGIEADVDGTLESMQKLNQSVSDTLAEVEVEGLKLDQYVSTIQELGNQSGLSATEQYRLQQAVEGYNDVVGTQYSVIDAANGKIADQSGVIQENTDELEKNAEAWKNRAKAEAYQSVAAEYMEEEVKASYELSVAQADLNEAYDEQARLSAIVNDETKRGTQEQTDAAMALDRLNREIPDMEQGVSDLSTAWGAAADNSEDFAAMAALQESLYSTLGDSTDAFLQSLMDTGISMQEFAALGDEGIQQLASSWDGSTQSIIEGLNAMGQQALVTGEQLTGVLEGFSNGEIAAALEGAGVNLDAFGVAMANAGISAQQLNEIGSANFAALAANCGGNIDQLIGMLSIYNSAPIYDKNGNITADTTQLVDAQGKVYTWNGTQLLTKNGSVVMTVTELYNAQGEVVKWNDSGQLVDKNGSVLVNDTQLTDANGQILTWNGTELVDRQGNVYVEQQELVDALGNTVEFNGTTLKPIEGTIYCDYSQLTNALNELSRLPKTYTSTVYINTVRTTTNRTVNEGATQSTQSYQPAAMAVQPLAAYASPMSAAAPMARGISTLSQPVEEATPVYAAGDDGIAHPVTLEGGGDGWASTYSAMSGSTTRAGSMASRAGDVASAVAEALKDLAINQTINFNQPMQTPSQVAYAMKRYATYGLAGAR